MPTAVFRKEWSRWPIAVAAALAVAALMLWRQGRTWICSCGYVSLWHGDAWSSETSQHLFDPYSFTHVLHGFAFCWLLALAVRHTPLKLSWSARFSLAVGLEALWEVFENSAFVIERYRETTAAFGYNGDTIVNSFGDVIACALGFVIADRLKFARTLALFFVVEAFLVFWIRDSLLLNLLMLIYQSETLKGWQADH